MAKTEKHGGRIIALSVLMVLIIGWLGLLALGWLSGTAMRRQAMADGRYAKIEIATGMVDGSVSLKQVTTAPAESKPEAPPSPVHISTDDAAKPPQVPPAPSETNPNATVNAAPIPEVKTEAPKPSPPSSISKGNPPQEAKPSLQETAQGYKLPKRDEKTKESPASYYRKPYKDTVKRPQIAVIVTGVGMYAEQNLQALSLPDTVTLSLSPYATAANGLREKAQSAGHEIWLDLMMQPKEYPADDAGPLALLKKDSELQSEQKLFQTMSTITNYVGLVASADDAFSVSSSMQPIAGELEKRGVALLLQQKTGYAPMEAKRVADQVIVSGQSLVAARQLFAEAEATALKRGQAVITLPANSPMIELLRQWLTELPAKNIEIVPLSALYP